MSREYFSQQNKKWQVVLIVAPIIAFLLAVSTSSVRQEIGLINVALALAIVTVIASIFDWRAGIATSVISAISVNYFHTEPIHSLRITSGNDIWTVSLLSVLGIAVSASSAVRMRQSLRDHHSQSAHEASSHLLNQLFVDRPVSEVWHESIHALCADLSMVNVRLDFDQDSRLPTISRQAGTINDVRTSAARVVLPESGAVVEFQNSSIRSRLILIPQPGVGSVDIDRNTVFTFVDHIEKSL